MQEVEEITINPFEETVGRELEELSGEKLVPIGAVEYNVGENYLLIGLNSLNDTKTYQIARDELPELESIDTTGRLLDMNGFYGVSAIQTEASMVTFPVDPTESYGDLTGVSFPFETSDGNTKKGSLDGRETVDLLLRRQGGLLLFEDQGLPVIPAIVVQEGNSAILVFLEDSRPNLKARNKYTNGMATFFRQVTKEITDKHYNEYWDSMAKRVIKATIDHPSMMLGEFYKARSAALVVDAAMGIKTSAQAIEAQFPPRSRLAIGKEIISGADVMNYLGVNNAPSVRSENEDPSPQITGHEIISELGSQRLIQLRLSVPDYAFGGRNDDMNKYFKKMAEVIKKARREDLDGALILLEELKPTEYAETVVVSGYDGNGKVKIYLPDDRGYGGYDSHYEMVHNLIERLENQIATKKWENAVDDNFYR